MSGMLSPLERERSPGVIDVATAEAMQIDDQNDTADDDGPGDDKPVGKIRINERIEETQEKRRL